MTYNDISKRILTAEQACKEKFLQIDDVAMHNQAKVLNAFKQNHISTTHFQPSNGYGYNDIGKEALNRLLSSIFNTEDALISPLIASGTHAINIMLFGILRPNDTLLSISGKPYDTLEQIINKEGIGSLKDFNINYHQIDYLNGEFDEEKILAYIKNSSPRMVYIQRSKGYAWQKSISINCLQSVISKIKALGENTIIAVDNCYGEFVDKLEPTDLGADLVVGSLIKNPGGGLAPSGGYIVGRKNYIELIANRMTAPALGKELGSYFASYLPYYQGLFLAPVVVKNALKSALLFSRVFSDMGFGTLPSENEEISDIICAIKFGCKEKLIEFCQTVQYNSPIDSFVTPIPGEMPGYKNEVIMAAGTFVQGASIELTADAPMREPYIGYIQGALTYEHAKIVLMQILKELY